MKLRPYTEKDMYETAELFYNTVHYINKIHYSKEQLDAWASDNIDINKWNLSLIANYTICAVNKKNIITGFGDIDKNGYLNRLYVHKDYQNQKIATLICNELEKINVDIITTFASITAKPFFEKRNYNIIRENIVERNSIKMKNYFMQKIK